MFTGLIADLGSVSELSRDDDGARLEISTPLAGQLAEGDSIAVNGVCLTASDVSEKGFAAEAMAETLRSAAAHGVPVSALAEYGEPSRYGRLPRLARQLAVADFAAVYVALALDNERALGG